ncbi:MAG TPA: hypothetical protein PKE45_18960 [Caldilineaceae bacterium]|nr:hypothetical protein [Caldilineaceae bacterium]
MRTGEQIYSIRIGGHLNPRWSEWFDGLEITHRADGQTILHGPIADQAALFGLLLKIRDLGLVLLALECTETCSAEAELNPSCM